MNRITTEQLQTRLTRDVGVRYGMSRVYNKCLYARLNNYDALGYKGKGDLRGRTKMAVFLDDAGFVKG